MIVTTEQRQRVRNFLMEFWNLDIPKLTDEECDNLWVHGCTNPGSEK